MWYLYPFTMFSPRGAETGMGFVQQSLNGREGTMWTSLRLKPPETRTLSRGPPEDLILTTRMSLLFLKRSVSL